MVDYHTHILPRMDDGSRSLEDSVRMLNALKEQGMDTVCLTPHFYGTAESPDRFLQRRREAYEQLKENLPADMPQLRLGAEVKYYHGVSRMEQLPLLRLDGTDILLLEMPFSRWNSDMLREVVEIQNAGTARVMLAHIERYLAWQSRGIWEYLLENGVIMQSNAEFFFAPMIRARAVKMLRQGRIHVLGTDTHNMTTRGPHMDIALQVIEKRLGPDAAERLKAGSDRLIGEYGDE